MWTFALWEKCSSSYSEEDEAHLPYGEEDKAHLAYGEEDKHTNHKSYSNHIINGDKLPLLLW